MDKRGRLTTQQHKLRMRAPDSSMLANLRDESLFSSLRSDHKNPDRLTKFGHFPRNAPEDYIKKRVASQLSHSPVPNLLNSTATNMKYSTRAESNPRISSMQKLKTRESNNNSGTDYINLNRRMTFLSRTMGKEAAMGESSFRKHNDGAVNASFPLT